MFELYFLSFLGQDMDSEKDVSHKQKKRCCCLRLKCSLCLIIFGIISVILGIVLRPVIDKVFRDKIDEKLVLQPGSPTYNSWVKPTIPIYAKFYFFDIVNPDEVKQGAKPVLEERGPYSYITHTQKVNITWQQSNATASYDEKTWYIFDSSTSCVSCDPFHDEITTINIPLMTVAGMLKNYPDFLHWKMLVSIFLESYNEQLFITRKVHDLLSGYEDPLLAELSKLREEIPGLKNIIPPISSTVILQPNNTLQGRTVVHTGAKDIQNVEQWKSWKGEDNLDLWLTKYANMLNGTDGRQFAPRVKKNGKIYIFVVQLCRSLYITYERELKDQDIDVYRFAIPQELFLNGSVNADNAAFYPNGFLPTGILDPRKCKGGEVSAPVFISAPHFYLGDPSLVDGVIGAKPNKEKHQFSFDVEPMMGVVLSNDIRLQVNVLIESVKDVTETASVPKVYVPVMWFQESATLDSGTTALFRNDIILPMEICHDVEIALICLGGVLVLIAMIILCCIMNNKNGRPALCCRHNEERLPLINAEN